MNAKELLAHVKALFAAPVIIPTVAPTDPINTILANDATYKLKDGGEIVIMLKEGATAPAVGDTVMVGGAPSPAADYILEDGSAITVDGAGTITVIVEAIPVTQPDFVAPEADPKAPTLEQRAQAIEDKISAIESKISGFSIPTDTVTPAQLQAAEAKIAKQDEIIKGLFEMAEKLLEEPTADPVTLSGAKKEKFDRIAKRDERFASIAETLKKHKQLS